MTTYKSYDEIPQEDFDKEVIRQAEKHGVGFVLGIPGVWELVSEDLNNDVLGALCPNPEEKPADERSDVDQHNPCEFSENYDWSKHDFENDPDWR